MSPYLYMHNMMGTKSHPPKIFCWSQNSQSKLSFLDLYNFAYFHVCGSGLDHLSDFMQKSKLGLKKLDSCKGRKFLAEIQTS
jgi:hypothetical protein